MTLTKKEYFGELTFADWFRLDIIWMVSSSVFVIAKLAVVIEFQTI